MTVATASAPSAVPNNPSRALRLAAAAGRRDRAVMILAGVAVVIVAMRFALPQQIELGWIVAALLAPIWVRAVARYRFGWTLVGIALLTAGASVWLSMADASSRATNSIVFTTQVGILIGAGLSVGLILWARTLFTVSTIAILFGIGMLIGVDSTSSAFLGNPWKFGLYYPIALISLGLAAKTRRWWIELIVVVVLMAICATHDFRSSFALLLLTAVLMVGQRPFLRALHGGSALLVVAGIAIATVLVTIVGQAAILGGLLGAETQARSVAQIQQSGSIIIGSRPELQATLALMQHSLVGFGAGAVPTGEDIEVAKTGMSQIGYDPDNGYVENYMLGNHFEVHSIFGDLWIQAGVVGLLMIAVILAVIVWSLSRRVAVGTAPAATLLMVTTTLWFIPFGPWFSSSPIVILGLALLVQRKLGTGRSRGDAPESLPVEP